MPAADPVPWNRNLHHGGISGFPRKPSLALPPGIGRSTGVTADRVSDGHHANPYLSDIA